jgi:hypothetical protein
MPDIELRGSGNSWQIILAGKPLPRHYSGHSMAMAALPGLERRLRKAAAQRRPCLRCKRTFASEGAHNRMCDHCRRIHY